MTALGPEEQIDIVWRRNVCQCGRHKKRGHPFCHQCFDRLSPCTRLELRGRVPGFGESYARAIEELKLCQQWRNTRYVDPRRRSVRAGGEA